MAERETPRGIADSAGARQVMGTGTEARTGRWPKAKPAMRVTAGLRCGKAGGGEKALLRRQTAARRLLHAAGENAASHGFSMDSLMSNKGGSKERTIGFLFFSI